MQSHNSSFYQNIDNSQNSLVNINDVVKVNNKICTIITFLEKSIIGVDMYNNKIEFTINNIQSVIFQDKKQSKMFISSENNSLIPLKKSLKNLDNKLKNQKTTLSKILTLKVLRTALSTKIQALEYKPKYRQLSMF